MIAATNIPLEGRAFLSALYVGESNGDYTILYGGGHFDASTLSLDGHYGFPAWGGKDNSHAAGAPQFEPATWLDVCQRLFPTGTTPDFRNPGDQDWGAWLLAQDVFRHSGKELLNNLQSAAASADNPALGASILASIASTLKPTWTSLDPKAFPSRFAAALISEAANTGPSAEPKPAPPPAPSPHQVPAPPAQPATSAAQKRERLAIPPSQASLVATFLYLQILKRVNAEQDMEWAALDDCIDMVETIISMEQK